MIEEADGAFRNEEMDQKLPKTISLTVVFFLLLYLLVDGWTGIAQSNEALAMQYKDPGKAIIFSSLFPGGGHFYLGDYKTGSFYLLTELGLLLAGNQVKDELERTELNIFHLHALKLHELNIFTAYRQARLRIDNFGYRNPIDDTPVSKLALAPFKWENIKDPNVYGFFLAGVVLNAIEASLNKERRSFQDVDKVQIMGKKYGRNRSLAAYETLWISISLNAAVSEECFYRGVIQSQLEEAMGKRQGLILTSLLFGLGHVSEPTETKSWVNGIIGSLSGFYLGKLYQNTNYSLEKPIAAHFWFNVAAGTTLFLLDPANNPLGLKVTFRFDL